MRKWWRFRKWRFRKPVTIKLRWPVRRRTFYEFWDLLTEEEKQAELVRCPCGCGVRMDDDDYCRLHGARV